MKSKIIFVIGMMLLVASQNADAACTQGDKIYSSCKPGYYLTEEGQLAGSNSNFCRACPSSGTSADKNATGITECYLPSGTTGSDATGTYEYTNDCYYGK